MKTYKIGDIVNLNDVNDIKNQAFVKAYDGYSKDYKISYEKSKRDIKKRIKFRIVEL